MLQIKDLHAGVDDKDILQGINLTVKAGEVHAIMGPPLSLPWPSPCLTHIFI